MSINNIANRQPASTQPRDPHVGPRLGLGPSG